MLFAAFLLVAFHLVLIFSGLVPNLVARPLHVALILLRIFIFTEQRAQRCVSVFGVALALAGMAAAVWIAVNADRLADQYGFVETSFQYAVGGVLLLSVLEAARRAIGWPLPVVAALALLYAAFGQHVPVSSVMHHCPPPA